MLPLEKAPSSHGANAHLGLDVQLLQLSVLGRCDVPLGQLLLLEEDLEVQRNALEAQHVISVRGDLNLQLRRLRLVFWLGALARVLVQFDAKLEA